MESDLQNDPRDIGLTTSQKGVGPPYTRHPKWPETNLYGQRWSIAWPTLMAQTTYKSRERAEEGEKDTIRLV